MAEAGMDDMRKGRIRRYRVLPLQVCPFPDLVKDIIEPLRVSLASRVIKE